MKQLINSLYWAANRNLTEMRKSDMKLSERIKFEKALVQLDALKKILENSEITTKP